MFFLIPFIKHTENYHHHKKNKTKNMKKKENSGQDNRQENNEPTCICYPDSPEHSKDHRY